MNKQSTAKLSTMLAVSIGSALVALAVVGTLYSTGIVGVPKFGASSDQLVSGVQASSPNSTVAGSGTADNRASLNAYASGVRNDLFRAADAPNTSGTATASPSIPRTNASASEPAHVSTPAQNGSVWMYTGTVSVGSKHYAVVENSQTHFGRFLQAGDRFGEGKVKSFSPESVMLIVNGRTEHLYKNRNYSLVPLSSNAPYMKVAASTGQPAATARPGQANPTNGASSATQAQATSAAGQAQAQIPAASTSNTIQVETGFVPANTNPVNTPGVDVQKPAPVVEPAAPLPVEIPTVSAPTRGYEPVPNVAYPYEFVNVRPGRMGMGPGRGR